MSLDVSLISKTKKIKMSGTGVFVRDNGATRELSFEEVSEKFPNAIISTTKEIETNEVYTANITHNLNKMAMRVGLYQVLWRPEELGLCRAKELIEPLSDGLRVLYKNAVELEKINPENKWGNYDNLVEFTENYLEACYEYPDARVEVSR